MNSIFNYSLWIFILFSQSITVNAEELVGRLFFTPEERYQIDQQTRQLGKGDMQINGYVLTLPKGQAAAWIDGQLQEGEGALDGLHIQPSRDPSTFIITTPDGKKLHVQVGDQIDTVRGTVNKNGIYIQPHATNKNRSQP